MIKRWRAMAKERLNKEKQREQGRGRMRAEGSGRQSLEGDRGGRERGGRLCGGVGQFSSTPYQNLADVQKHTQECVSEPVLMTMRGLGHAYVMGT